MRLPLTEAKFHFHGDFLSNQETKCLLSLNDKKARAQINHVEISYLLKCLEK